VLQPEAWAMADGRGGAQGAACRQAGILHTCGRRVGAVRLDRGGQAALYRRIDQENERWGVAADRWGIGD
jgi:hypothetical protein